MSGAMAMQILKNHIQRDPVDKVESGAVTVRPSSTALLTIDSKDRYANVLVASAGTTSPYSFQITKTENILNGYLKRIALTEIVFPYYIPNINTRTDKIQCSIDGGAPVTLSIPVPGFYTPSQIAGALEFALVGQGLGAATVSYSEGRFNFNAGPGRTIAFSRGNYVGGPLISQFQLFDLLNLNSTINGTPFVSQVSGVTRCRYTEYIDIVCSQLTYNQELKDGTSSPIVRDAIARVYIEADDSFVQPYWNTTTNAEVITEEDIPGTYPFTIYRKFPHPKQIRWENSQPIGNLKFEVYDDKGQILSAFFSALGPAGVGLLPDSTLPNWRMSVLVSED